MFSPKTTRYLAAAAILAFSACDDSPTDPNFDGGRDAAVEGRVAETTPESGASGAPQQAPGTNATTVSVVRLSASGSYEQLASADLQADGSYRVEGVPTGLTDAAVVAYVDGRAAGEVLIHGETRSGQTLRVAPISYETTMETRTYARVLASGRAQHISPSEISLLLRVEGSELESTLDSEAEIQAIADGAAEAGATMNVVFADEGVALDASARSTLLVDAVLDLTEGLFGGLSVGIAHDDYVDAAIDAYTGAGASFESVIRATAASATTFDAALEGRTEARGRVVSQPVLINLRARERAAASFDATAEAALAIAIEASLGAAHTAVGAAETAAELRTALEARLDATVDAATDAAVELLAADASLTVRANVAAEARSALAEATLGARLEGATTASAAASAMADYRASVRAAVQAMVDAASNTTADVEVITELFIAACGGASVG